MKVKASKNAVFDDFIDADDDLILVERETNGSSEERRLKLVQKNQAAERRKAVSNMFSVQDNRLDDSLCCVCDGCGYVFYRKDDSEYFSCPHCQARHHFEPVEEMSVSLMDDKDVSKHAALLAKEQAIARRKAVFGSIRPITQDSHVDDAKTQSSLQMGTPEYKEYVADKQESDPMKPDDEFHVELELHNETLDDRLLEAVPERAMGEFKDRKALYEAMKREYHDEYVGEMRVEASKTPTLDDDNAVNRIGIDNPVMNDIGVFPDEYQKQLEDYAASL